MSPVTTIFYFLITTAALVLNFIELYLLAQIKQRKAYEKFLMSLSVSDVCASVTEIVIISLYFTWKGNEHVMGLNISTYFFFVVISFLHLFWICLDRLWAVVQPIQHNIFVTGRKVITLIAVTWITVCIAGIICFVTFEMDDPKKTPRQKSLQYRKKINLATGVLIIVADIIYISAYAFIVFTVRRKTITSTKSSSQRRVVILSIAMALAFVVSTFPYALFRLGAIPKRAGGYWVNLMVMLNGVSNPSIYLVQTYSCRCHRHFKSQDDDAIIMKNRGDSNLSDRDSK